MSQSSPPSEREAVVAWLIAIRRLKFGLATNVPARPANYRQVTREMNRETRQKREAMPCKAR